MLCAGALGIALLAACTDPGPPPETAAGATGHYVVPAGIHKIKHVIIIMQENRSFDSYFGTYPGRRRHPDAERRADGLRAEPGRRVPRPYHDTPMSTAAARTARSTRSPTSTAARWTGSSGSGTRRKASCTACPTTRLHRQPAPPDVMGYHTAAEIPNYWTYAKDFVLDDHMFEPVTSWSLPDHLYLVSGWSAKCWNRSPMSCVNDIDGPYGVNSSTRRCTRS